jgi:sec-independent protein translocase protein TatA
MDLGAPELLIILVIVGLLFGANRLPGLARSMGSAVSEFKKGQHEGETDAAKPVDTVQSDALPQAEARRQVDGQAVDSSPNDAT